jgi:hypothetical protein
MQRKVWLAVIICLALGAAIGYPMGSVVVGAIYGVLIGTGIGLILDRRYPPKPYVG